MSTDKSSQHDSKGNRDGSDPPASPTDPFELLQAFDDPNVDDSDFALTHKHSQGVYKSLIKILRDRNGEPKIAKRLWTMASDQGSLGAARALLGCTNEYVLTAACRAIEAYLHGDAGPVSSPKIKPVGVLALAGTTDPSKINLLQRAIRYQRGTKNFEQQDLEFCQFASAALAQCKSEEACQAILVLLVETSLFKKYGTGDTIGGSICHGLSQYPNVHVAKECDRLLSLPKRKAVYLISRNYEKMSCVNAAYHAFFRSKEYDAVLTAFYRETSESRWYHASFMCDVIEVWNRPDWIAK